MAAQTVPRLAACRPSSISTDFDAQIVPSFVAQGPPMGIDTPLVDAEGFPRADIDVYRARTLRKRFKEIQTDHKALEQRIAAGIVELSALTSDGGGGSEASPMRGTTAKEDEEEKRARRAPKPKPKFDPKTGKWVVKSWDGSVAGVEDGEKRSFEDLSARSASALAANLGGIRESGSDDGGGTSGQTPAQQQQQQQQRQVSFQPEPAAPFAIIDEVASDSPASEAGLKEGDLVFRFGAVTGRDGNEFRAIAALVPAAAAERKSIAVSVRRKTTELGGLAEVVKTEVVDLRPRPWGGRGLLGCHIRPYDG
ncbi:hypothetical protein ACHAWF_008416 [Thalassiosira exigua]